MGSARYWQKMRRPATDGMSGGEVREGFRDSFGTGHAEIVYVICFRGMREIQVDDGSGKVSAVVRKAAVMIDIGSVVQLLNNAQVLLDGRFGSLGHGCHPAMPSRWVVRRTCNRCDDTPKPGAVITRSAAAGP